LTANNKKKKVKPSPYKAKRTVPSPVSPPQYGSNNGNFDNDKLESPHDYHYNHHLYQQRAASNPNHSHFYEDEPMSPAIQTEKRSNIRRSKRLEHKNIESPPMEKQQRSQPIKQAHQPDSPGIAPSIPPYMQRQNATNKNLSPMKYTKWRGIRRLNWTK